MVDDSKKRKRKSAQIQDQLPAKKQRVEKRPTQRADSDEDESFMFNQMSGNNGGDDDSNDDEEEPPMRQLKKKKSLKKFVPIRKNK